LRKPEQRLWDTMKVNRPMQVGLERVENGVLSGMPDVHGVARGVTVWFELKVLRYPKRDSTHLFKKQTLRKAQVAWHRVYAAHGGRSYILVRDQHRQLYLIPGEAVGSLSITSAFLVKKTWGFASWPELFVHAFRKQE